MRRALHPTHPGGARRACIGYRRAVGVYRENAIPATETLHDFPVSTRRGHALVVFLGVVAILLLVAGGVSIVMGAPPEIQAWEWPMTIAGTVVLVAALAVHRTRRRRLKIVRVGDRHTLVIEREHVHLEFPLGMSGDQMKNMVNHVPMYEVWLKLVDANHRTGIFLSETRGAIHGPQHDWLRGVDKSVACERFESGKVDMLARLRDVVDSINARYKS